MFRIASGPLVWGRVAAALMRLGQSVLQHEGCLSCFVDDPLCLFLGNGDAIITKQLRVALVWTALGSKWRGQSARQAPRSTGLGRIFLSVRCEGKLKSPPRTTSATSLSNWQNTCLPMLRWVASRCADLWVLRNGWPAYFHIYALSANDFGRPLPPKVRILVMNGETRSNLLSPGW